MVDLRDSWAQAKWLGYLYEGEVRALKELINSFPKTQELLIINIGAGSGTSSLAMAEERPDANIVTVDKSEGGPLGGLLNERNAFDASPIRLPTPTQILGDSGSVGKKWQGGLVDLLFIDGDHSAEGVQRDIDGWAIHMADGGIIAFHDYGEKWKAVVHVVDKNMRGNPFYELILHTDTLIAFRFRQAYL